MHKLKTIIWNYPGKPLDVPKGVELLRFDDVTLRDLITIYKYSKGSGGSREESRALIYCLANGFYQIDVYKNGRWEIRDSWIMSLSKAITESICGKWDTKLTSTN